MIAEHIGSNDPKSQDPVIWTRYHTPTAEGPGDDGQAHWYIRNNAGVDTYYKFDLTDYLANPSPDGWTATAVARLVTANSRDNAFFSVTDGSDWWGINLIDGAATDRKACSPAIPLGA